MTKVKNTSGIKAMGYNLLIRPEEIGEKIGSIILTVEYRDRSQVSATKGTVVDVSPTAFTFVEGCPTVKPGDEVLFPRHSAMIVDGEDEERYFIIKDKDIAAVKSQ